MLAGQGAFPGTIPGASAQNSTQAPSPSASKFSGGSVEGDPNGAVRALGSADDSNEGKRKPSVVVPHLGGEGENRTGGLPAGTTGPAR